MTAKNFALRHYPDATIRKAQSGTQRGIEYRITYDKKGFNDYKQITATSALSAWMMLRKLIEQEK
jgi:hypothetical protein